MQPISHAEAMALLDTVHLKIGEWGRLCDTLDRPYPAACVTVRQAPSDALALYQFMNLALQWLDTRGWALLQIDDSTNFISQDDAFSVFSASPCEVDENILNTHRSFLFKACDSQTSRDWYALRDLAHKLLLFGYHGQIVAQNSTHGLHLSVQDGFIYFKSREPGRLASVDALLSGQA